MKTTLKYILRALLVLALLIVGFAAGFPVGKSIGFTTGSEWAIVQADILARQMGMSMPVYYEDGHFRVIVKQSRHLYKQAWQSADRYQNEMEIVNQGEKPLVETAFLSRNIRITK